MEKSLQLYIDNESGIQEEFFYSVGISAFTVDYKRMGNAPTITCKAKYHQCLDNKWEYGLYTIFNNERFYLKQIPSSSFSNKDSRYIYDLEFCSERAQLDNIFVFDVVSDTEDAGRPVSSNSNFSFFGTIEEFAKRLNNSLVYTKMQKVNDDGDYISGYRVIIDGGIVSEGKLVTIENKVFSECLQESFHTFKIPYYFVGTDIHLGFAPNTINETFQYGAENSLLSIKRENAKSKVITRITGTGSEDNLPYYYPNPTPLGDVRLQYKRGNLTQDNAVTIGNMALFSKNKLSNVFKYHYQADKLINIKGFNWVINVLQEFHPIKFKYVKYYARKKFNIKGTTATGEFCVKFNSPDGDTELNPHFKLSNAETGETIGEWDGERIKLWSEWDGTGRPSTAYYFNWVSLKKFNTLIPGEYKLEITYIVHPRRLDLSAYEYFDKYMLVELTYYRPKEQYWLLENKSISSLSDYGIKTLVEPKDGDTIELKQDNDTWLVPQKRLMPPIYRATLGAERFYNAKNGTYVKPETDGYYKFTNKYVEDNPREHIAEFEEIKPSIVGITNKDGEQINSFIEFAYDDNDNDEKDEEGHYIHPYFFAKLRKLNGQKGSDTDLGFNLFDRAIESGEMTISMTSGNCGGCQWVVVVDADYKFNPVQVNEDGTLKRDENGNVICGREGQAKQQPQERQQDTINNEVWIALRKDNQTFHTVMPNSTNSYKPKADIFDSGVVIKRGDEFVILNIHLPQSYITAAEERLKQELIRYMADNNDEKFKFSIDFSKVYFAEHEDVLASLNENSRINIKYNDIETLLYVNSFSYSIKENDTLPDIKVELSEDIEITNNVIQQAVTQVETQLSVKISNLDIQKLAAPYFHRKDISDQTNSTQTFTEGIKIGNDKEYGFSHNGVVTADGFRTKNFEKGFVGASIYTDETGTVAEVDYLNVRKKATFKDVEIQETRHIGGKLELTAAECKCEVVEYIKDSEDNVVAFKVYFRRYSGENELITNKWQVGDQARCDTFNLEQNKDGSQGNRYYWRLVTEVGTGGYALDDKSMAEYHWIVLSNKESETITLDGQTIQDTLGFDNGSSAPLNGDSIIQLGNRFGTAGRVSAIELAGAGTDSPYIRQYENIKTFELGGVDTQIKPGDNKFKGRVSIEDGSYGVGNFSDFPEEIHNAVQVGVDNILRNTGFDGEHGSLQVEQQTELSEEVPVYSEQLALWTIGSVVSVVPSEKSVSGFACKLEAEGSSIEQTVTLIKDEVYVLSFMCAGIVRVVNLSADDYGNGLEDVNCRVDVIGTGEPQVIKIASIVPNSLIWNLKLERGTIQTDWVPSQQDTDPIAESFRHLWYLQDALKGKTEILGGLILSSMLQLGNYRNGVMEQVTAGVSGITRNPDTDVAFWGGGTFEQAIKAVNMFKNNPSYQPTNAEVAEIAKAVITHGGRAILNDIVLRGYVYALGGVFQGDIIAKRNIVSRLTKSNATYVNVDGDDYLVVDNAFITGMGKYVLPELEVGQTVEVTWFCPPYDQNNSETIFRVPPKPKKSSIETQSRVGIGVMSTTTTNGISDSTFEFVKSVTIKPKNALSRTSLYKIFGDCPFPQEGENGITPAAFTYWTLVEIGAPIDTDTGGVTNITKLPNTLIPPPWVSGKIELS